MDYTVFGLEIAPVVMAIVNVLKRFGIEGRASLIAAMATAAVLVAIKEIVELYPQAAVGFQIVIHVLSAALWASTLFDGIKALNGRS